MHIPFSPPFIDQDIIDEVTDTLKSGWITTGPKTRLLEEIISNFCNIEKTLAVNSATSALMLVLHWLGLSENDEVIIPAYTYCATALSVIHAGGIPVMVDVKDDFNIDPEKIRQAVTSSTKAIITVDFGGWPCDYEKIYDIVNEDAIKSKFNPSNETQKKLSRILVISDAAHAFGAVYNNMPVGKCADITVFSLHAVKNVTSSEGGMICLNLPDQFNNQDVYNTFKLWSLHGQTKDAFTKSQTGGWKYDVVYPGYKINMPDVLAAIALAQLKKYKTTLLPLRKQIFEYYTNAFKEYPWAVCPPFEKENCCSSYHIYPFRIKGISEDQRDLIIQKIATYDITVNVHFIPLPMLTIFRNDGYNIKDYPVSYQQYCNEISLPIYPQLSPEACKYITDSLIMAVQKVLE